MNKKLEDYSREELIEEIKSLKKRKKFGLVWEDKKEDIVEKCKNEIPVLKEVPELAINEKPGEPTNLIIEGDNFASLQVLNYTHHGKIDVIYIDPPYNTGNKDFIYNDSYVDSEDSFRHSKWLSFMDRRLRLAKELLSDDGVIFISIDDNEQANLLLLCNEVFGADNRLSTISVVNNLKGRSDDAFFATAHESLLVYAKNRDYANIFGLPMPDDFKKEYKYSDNISSYKEVSLQKTGKGSRRIDRPNMYYPIYYNEKTLHFSEKPGDGYIEIYPAIINGSEGRWRWGKQTFVDKKDTELVARKVNDIWRIYVKMRDVVDGAVRTIRPKTIWIDPKYDTGIGGRRLKEIFKNDVFSSPKPIEYIKDILRVGLKTSGLILDFFAGSGTTGQAVLELNKEDGGNRKFILCTNNESNIARDVTYPRIKTVVTGIRPDGSKYSDGIPANVRYFTTDFIEKGITGDVTRAKLFEKSDEMIQVRENAFEFVDKNNNYTFYKNNEKFVAIIKDPFNFGPIWYELEEKNTEKLPVKLYVFSYSNYTFEDEIPDTDLKYEICAIPNSIMEVYRKISDKKEER